MRGKKGQLGTLPAVLATLIVIFVLLSAGFFINQEFQEQDEFYTSSSVTDESGGYINSTGYTLASERGAVTKDFSITAAYNVSNSSEAILITAGNYTLDSTSGLVTNASDTVWADVNFTYTYSVGEEGWSGVNDTLDAMRTIPDLLGLIILIVLVGLVLAVVFNVIPGARVSGA